jgi:adenosylcobinamide-GDP ribazoletransferase
MGFLTALAFLTRLPLRPDVPHSLPDVARAQGWFPAVGLFLGALLWAFDRLALHALPEASVDVLLVVALAALSGALHLDGLADAADGLFGGQDRESRLAIMRDVHRGTYAIVAVAGVLALKWAGLIGLPADVRVEAIVLTPCLGRYGTLVATATFPYAREDGVGAGFREHAFPGALVFGTLVTLVASVLLLGAGGLLVAAFVVGCALAIGFACTRAVGGMTGDLYGATVEVTEAFALLFIASLAAHRWVEAWVLA